MQLSFRDCVIVLTQKQIFINYILVSYKIQRVKLLICLIFVQSYKAVKWRQLRNISGSSGKRGENILFFTLVTLFGHASVETKISQGRNISVLLFFLKTFWFSQ